MSDEESKYPKGDLRRMLAVLGAIDALGEHATMPKIGKATGLHRRTVDTQVHIARTQAAVRLTSKIVEGVRGTVYVIESWGPAIKRSGARLAFEGTLEAAQEVDAAGPADEHPPTRS